MLSTTHILHKIFHIKQGDGVGTGFIIELDNREYLITARHVVPNQARGVKIYHKETWEALPVVGIYHHPANIDVAAIAINRQIAPRCPTYNDSSGTSLGEDVMMVGFPSSIHHSCSDSNFGYPIPFVKTGVVSSLVTQDGIRQWYFDGHNHSGFSGSPIIANQRPSADPNPDVKIIGIETGYSLDSTCTSSELRSPPDQVNGYPVALNHVHITNTGFVIGVDIKHAIEIVQTYPYGFLMDG